MKTNPQKRSLRIGGYYRHYKNNLYKVHGIVRHSETLEEMALYECLYENKLGAMWVRPLDMFLGQIEIDGKAVDRFADAEAPSET